MSPFDRIPPEILSHILLFVAEDLHFSTSKSRRANYLPLLRTSLVARAWTHPSQEQLFSVVNFLYRDTGALQRWLECPVVDKFKTRVLCLDEKVTLEDDERMKLAIARCPTLQVLNLRKCMDKSSELLPLPSLSRELQELTLCNVPVWSIKTPFTLALTSLHLDGDGDEYAINFFLALLSSPTKHTLRHLTVHPFDDPEFITTVAAFAPNLTELCFLSHPPTSLHPHLATCKNLIGLQCDSIWKQTHPSIISLTPRNDPILDALPSTPLTTLKIHLKSFPVRVDMRTFDHVVFDKLQRVVFLESCYQYSNRETEGVRDLVAWCGRRDVEVVWEE